MRFRLSALLVFVSLLAIAFAAARANSEIIEILLESVLGLLICFGVTFSITSKGTKRMFWVGLCVFAIGYAVSASVPRHFFQRSAHVWGPAAGVNNVLVSLRPPLSPGRKVFANWQGVEYAAVVKEIDPQGRLFVVWDDGSQPRWLAANQVRVDSSVGIRSGHLVVAILFGMLGGYVSTAVRKARNESQLATAV